MKNVVYIVILGFILVSCKSVSDSKTYDNELQEQPNILLVVVDDMAGIAHPDTYKGKNVLPMRGKSFAQVLSGENESLYDHTEYIAGEMQDGKWIRKGSYKAEFVTKPYGTAQWKLYDLAIDPGETTDISDQNPELLKEFISAWEKYAEEVGVVLAE